jgi:hypothetical protein
MLSPWMEKTSSYEKTQLEPTAAFGGD